MAGIETVPGPYQRLTRIAQLSTSKAGDADLADTRQVGIGRFHVNRDKVHTGDLHRRLFGYGRPLASCGLLRDPENMATIKRWLS